MRLERLNNLPLNTVTTKVVAIFVFFGTASSFVERISFPEIEAKREAILFLFGCLEVNSTWIITSGLAKQRAPKALFTCVVYTNNYYYSRNCSTITTISNDNENNKIKIQGMTIESKYFASDF